MSTEQVHPRAQPSSLALPIDKGTFDDIVATLRHVVVQQYTALREEFMTKTLGTSPEDRKKRTPAQVDKDFITLKKADPLLSGSDPFNAAWLPGKGADIPPFPPREVHAARQGPHPLSPKDGLMLDAFMLENDRLLAMTIEEMQAVPYIDAWLFKFALTRYFDVESAAPRFLKMRSLIYKHNLSFNYDATDLAGCFNGRNLIDPAYVQSCTKPGETPIDAMAPVEEEVTTTSKGDEKVAAEISLPVVPLRAAVQIMTPRYMDWSKVTVAQMIKFEFLFNMMLISTDYFVQTHGVYMAVTSKDASSSNFSKPLFSFTIEMMKQSLPTKVKKVYICNERWFFNMVIAPLLKFALSKKMLNKLTPVTSKDYTELAHLGRHRIFPEIGGTLKLQPGEESANASKAFVEAMVAHAQMQQLDATKNLSRRE